MRRSARIAALNSNSSSTKPNRKRKAAEEKQTMPVSKPLHFTGPYRQQNWPFRNSLIHYITQNPSNAKGWQKLIQSCKYFFAKNPILVVKRLDIYTTCWVISDVRGGIPLRNISFKLWAIGELIAVFPTERNFISSLIPLLYRCDATLLSLNGGLISYDDFSIISSKAENIGLRYAYVKNEDGSSVSVENLVKFLSNVKKITLANDPEDSFITKNSVKEFLRLPYFPMIKAFTLFDICEEFDIDAFFTYLKKNKYTKFRLHFADSISMGYKHRLEEIVDEILSTENNDYKMPCIKFAGIDEEKYRKFEW